MQITDIYRIHVFIRSIYRKHFITDHLFPFLQLDYIQFNLIQMSSIDLIASFKATSAEEKVAFTKAEEVRKSKERIEKSKQVTVEELTIAVCKYRELGLDFVKGDNGALLFNFTKIDERNVDRIFSFRLMILEQDDEYLVEECCPKLKEEVVMRLVQELNQTEDYPSFMRGMRKAFVDYVADEV